jgi:hypothetical protein
MCRRPKQNIHHVPQANVTHRLRNDEAAQRLRIRHAPQANVTLQIPPEMCMILSDAVRKRYTDQGLLMEAYMPGTGIARTAGKKNSDRSSRNHRHAVGTGPRQPRGHVDRDLPDDRTTTLPNTDPAFRDYVRSTYELPAPCPRFGTGEAKGGLLPESVRGYDLMILTDVCNYSLTYRMNGFDQPHVARRPFPGSEAESSPPSTGKRAG